MLHQLCHSGPPRLDMPALGDLQHLQMVRSWPVRSSTWEGPRAIIKAGVKRSTRSPEHGFRLVWRKNNEQFLWGNATQKKCTARGTICYAMAAISKLQARTLHAPASPGTCLRSERWTAAPGAHVAPVRAGAGAAAVANAADQAGWGCMGGRECLSGSREGSPGG